MSVSITQMPALLNARLFPVMLAQYAEQPQIAPLITEAGDLNELGAYGTQGSVLGSIGKPTELRDGQEVPADTFKQSYTWYVKNHMFGLRLDIPKRLMDAHDGEGQVGSMVANFAKEVGRTFPQMKEQRVADVFQKGTLSAGDASVFDGSRPGVPDPNVGFIYDGKPFFAATGNGHVLASASETPYNLTVSLALDSANLQTVLTTYRTSNAVNDRAQKIINEPELLLTGPSLEFTARALLNSTLIPDSGNNTINVVQGILTPVVWRYLTDAPTAWYVGRKAGVVVYDSGEPVIDQVWDAKSQTYILVATTTHAIVVKDWRPWYCANKAAS